MASDSFLFQKQWAKAQVRHHHGLAFPLSSLRTKNSHGIGEILDLIPMISWLGCTGFSLMQFLPLNDSGSDPSPYMALSAYALHPIYISLDALPEIQSISLYQKLAPELKKLALETRVSYQAVLEKKLQIIRAYFNERKI